MSASNDSEAKASKNEADPRKMFVGGLSWETTIDELREYFTQFGAVKDATIKTDGLGTSRGFGFILFEEESSVEKVLAAGVLSLKEKKIEAKKAAVKEIKKIFVGGVNPQTPEDSIRIHFEQYGEIEAIELPMDKEKAARRGFIFVTFKTVEACNAATAKGKAKQELGENVVDVKKAVPQKAGGAGDYGGGYDYGYGYGYAPFGPPRGRGGRGARGAPRGRGGPRGGAAPYNPYGYDPYAGYDFSADYGGYGDPFAAYGYPPAPGGGKMRGRGRGARGAPY